jgi:hypothetical protein
VTKNYSVIFIFIHLQDNIWTDLYVLISMMIAYRIIAFLILLIKARLSVRHKTAQSDVAEHGHKNDTPT